MIAALSHYQKTTGVECRNEMIGRIRVLYAQNEQLSKQREALIETRSKLINLVDAFSLPELNRKLQEANTEIEKLEATMQQNSELMDGVSKTVQYEFAIDPKLDPEDEDQRLTLYQTMRDIVAYIAADMEKRSAKIDLKNELIVEV